MNWKKFWKSLSGFLGDGGGFVREVEKSVGSTLEKAERKIEHVTIRAIKAASVFLMIFIGLILALVGLSKYVGQTYFMTEGMGYIVVGAVLILLGWFAKLIRP